MKAWPMPVGLAIFWGAVGCLFNPWAGLGLGAAAFVVGVMALGLCRAAAIQWEGRQDGQ
jgi:hypothetical protein